MSSPLFQLEDLLHANIPLKMPMTYLHLNQGPEKPLLLFFHGYSDSAMALVRRAFPHLDSRFEILAPNGLFPAPVKREDEWKQAFAWYFADYSKNRVIIPPSVSAEAVLHLIQELNLENRPKILIGFSQGGFFLPFILPYLKNVQKMFAIGAGYRTADYPDDFSIVLDAFHGQEDQIITVDQARESFQRLKSTKNPRGEFFEFKGLGHTMNDEARLLLKSRIEEVVS